MMTPTHLENISKTHTFEHVMSQLDKEISFPLLCFLFDLAVGSANLLGQQLTKPTRIASPAT